MVVRYVSPLGNDSAAGTKKEPWKTLKFAVSRLNPGTVVYLKAGTYYGPVNIDNVVDYNLFVAGTKPLTKAVPARQSHLVRQPVADLLLATDGRRGLEGGVGGYWSVSMQNLYTAAAALHNVRGIDLRGHPGFEQATQLPMMQETTVPPIPIFTGFRSPLPQQWTGPLGMIDLKPIALPSESTCGAWWFDYAVQFPNTPAQYYARKWMIAPDKLTTCEAHQGALCAVLTIAWWNNSLLGPSRPPLDLALFTDRMAGVRSGHALGDTYLYFNGDMFLSAKKEILCTTAGLAWHFPWHQYQIAETGIETEGEPFAPSMIIREARNDAAFAYYFRAESGFSNVSYDPQIGQRESYKHYDRRERSVLFVRGGQGRPDYFLFDDVRQQAPRWHAWTWHLWNSKWFDHYTPTFAGMLEPGLTVPFGDGWKKIAFPSVPGVAAVRVAITKYWGIGGGLNEVQDYGPAASKK